MSLYCHIFRKLVEKKTLICQHRAEHEVHETQDVLEKRRSSFITVAVLPSTDHKLYFHLGQPAVQPGHFDPLYHNLFLTPTLTLN